jgi:hypothetical protein
MPEKAKKPAYKQPATIASAQKAPSQKAINIKPAPQAPDQTVSTASSSFNASVPSYGKSFMCAVPKDPGAIFVYWEIGPATINELRKTAGDDAFNSSKWIVRIIDATDSSFDGTSAGDIRDIIIDRDERKKYVKAPESGRAYLLEFGILTPDNVFFRVVKSNRCEVPWNMVSDRLDEAWNMVGTTELIRISTDALGSGAAVAQGLNGLGITLGEGSGSGSIM